jgi:hypothetical protein
MASQKRAQLEPTDEWQQLQFHLDWTEQTRYELIRPVVVFGSRPLDRAKQTGVSARTIYRRAERFDQLGMQSLFEAEPIKDQRALPAAIRQAIVQLKAEYPAFRPNELATICDVRFNRRPSSHTIKKVLAAAGSPGPVVRRFLPYGAITDPVARRAAIVRLHAEGWNIASIAGYLQTNRPRVYKALKRWIEEGVHGLGDKPPIPQQPATKTTLWAMNEARKLQRNPELGAFRLHVALKQLGITLSTRTCGRILARNRKLYGLRGPEAKPREPKPMPFKAAYRHQYWTTDIRYLDHQLGGGNVYCISILENYSRLIVASMLSRTQDTTAFLAVLLMAVREHGAPDALVSDGGGVFRATRSLAIYKELGMAKEQIARRQPWQSYIETAFNVQRRMADWDFGRAQTWQELQELHAAWVHDYNTQEHWAHQKRQDGRRSPKDVLGWHTGGRSGEEDLARIFAPARFWRRVDRQGYVRFRNWRLYGERGLVGRPTVVWLTEEHLTLQYREDPLAHYAVTHRRDRRQLATVTSQVLYQTRFASPQPQLPEVGPDYWQTAIPQPRHRRRRRLLREPIQASLFGLEDAAGDR